MSNGNAGRDFCTGPSEKTKTQQKEDQQMKKLILILVIAAVVAIIAYKLIGNKSPSGETNPTSSTTSSRDATPIKEQALTTFYLFHNPQDQDEECRQIYAFADRAERELVGRLEVKRPDVKAEKSLVDKFQVRVLPTVLIISPTGEVQERFEGEGEAVASRIETALRRLKDTQK